MNILIESLIFVLEYYVSLVIRLGLKNKEFYVRLERSGIVTNSNSNRHRKNANTAQYIYKEISTVDYNNYASPVEDLSDLTEEERDLYKEALLIIREKLQDAMYRLMRDCLTKHQNLVMRILYTTKPSGYDTTYSDVAEKLKINYTGVSHSVMGIKSTEHNKMHGGSLRKIKKFADKDPEIQHLLKMRDKLVSTQDIELAKILIEADMEDTES